MSINESLKQNPLAVEPYKFTFESKMIKNELINSL